MALLTLTTLSLGIAVAGDALGSGIVAGLASGVAGNYAHEACKGALQTVAQQAEQGQLFANHVLLRAARRAHLRATQYCVAQFSLSFSNQPERSVSHLAAWCRLISKWLDEEAKATRRKDYRLPQPALLARHAALLAHRPEGETLDGLREALANQVLAQLTEELQAWHTAEAAARGLMPDLPEGFVAMLAQGWLSEPLPESPARRLLGALWRRRGEGADMSARSQGRLPAADTDARHTSWFEVFAAFFSEELHTDPAVHAAFTQKLVTHLVLQQNATQEAAASALREELARWGQGFCSHVDQLVARLDAGHVELLGRLAQAQSRAERDSLTLADIAEGVHDLQQGMGVLLERVQPAARRSPPWQLPPRAIEDSFTGREAQLAALLARLEARKPVTYVHGPAGFGKTALAAEALALCGEPGRTPLAELFPEGLVYLDLYLLKAHAAAVCTALADALLGAGTLPQLAPDQRAREACAGRRLLIVLEGAERANGRDGAMTLAELATVLAPENCRLVLTRESAQTLPAQTIRLDGPLAPDEAAALFDRLAVPPPPPAVREQVLALLEGHPLALTWAASLLADPAENPWQLVQDWQQQALPSLADPQDERRRRTLSWVFERSLRHVDAGALAALEALGLLAHAAVEVSAIVVALGVGEPEARSALKRLGQAALLRHQVGDAEESWQFSHVLAHGFARERASAVEAPEGLQPLLRWVGHEIGATLTAMRSSAAPGRRLSALLQHAEALLSLAPRATGWELFQVLLYDVSAMLVSLGQLGLSRASLDAAAGWFGERAAEVGNGDATHDRERYVWLGKQGNLRVWVGRLDEASQAYEESLTLARRLAATNAGNTQWQRDVGVALNNVGGIRQAQGRLDEALQAYEESLTLARRLAATDASNTEWQRDVGVALERVGRIRQAQGRLDEASQAYEEWLTLARRLAATDASNTQWQRDVGVALERVGDIRQAQGRRDEALQAYEESLTLRRGLAATDASNTEWQRDVGVALNNVGGIRQAQGRLDEALQAYEESLSLARRLAATDASNTAWQRDVGVSLNNVGSIRQAQGRLDEALQAYEESLTLRRRLAATDASNTQWQRDVGVALNNVGRIRQAQARLGEALQAFEESLTLRRRLAATDASNIDWQRDLSVSLTNVAEVLALAGRRDEACVLARESLAIDERLVALAPEHAEWQRDVQISRALVRRVCGPA